MAKKKRKKTSKTRRRVAISDTCYFCDKKTSPYYLEHEDLAKFLTDRAKILGTRRSGICSKHQRKLSREIKRARYLGLLPYSPQI